MKNLISLIICFCLAVHLYAQQNISKQQNQKNIEYLTQLDANINGTLQLLSAFHDTAGKMPDSITGLDLFSRFLLELTLECSKLKKSISAAGEMSHQEREIQIQRLISTLHPNVAFLPFHIDRNKDEQNREAMQILHAGIIEQVIELQKKILQEELGIIESYTFHKYFFHLHSQHFIYQLLLDFIEPSEKLSEDNRNYLLRMARHLEASMQEEKSDSNRN